jgi:hypothetical protein
MSRDVCGGAPSLRRGGRYRAAPAIAIVLLVAATAVRALEPPAPAPSPSPTEDEETHANVEVTDPVSLTWSLKLQNNINLLDVPGFGNQVQDTVVFQPTMPMWLARTLKLIARPKFTLLDDQPYTSQGELHRVTGVGDTILDLALSPSSNPWLLGAGPTFVFPTASNDQTGQGKWQMGPAAVFGYRAERWLASIILQQWWSFAGSSERSNVSAMNLQYSADYFFGAGWNIGTSPTIKVNWLGSAGQRVTFPFGPTLGKVVKLGGVPVKFEIEAAYSPVHPESNGQILQIKFNAIPVIPGLMHGFGFGDSR